MYLVDLDFDNEPIGMATWGYLVFSSTSVAASRINICVFKSVCSDAGSLAGQVLNKYYENVNIMKSRIISAPNIDLRTVTKYIVNMLRATEKLYYNHNVNLIVAGVSISEVMRVAAVMDDEFGYHFGAAVIDQQDNSEDMIESLILYKHRYVH